MRLSWAIPAYLVIVVIYNTVADYLPHKVTSLVGGLLVLGAIVLFFFAINRHRIWHKKFHYYMVYQAFKPGKRAGEN